LGKAEEPLSEAPLLTGAVLADIVGEATARGLPFRFRAGGSSMFPFIRDGDVILILPLAEKSPRLGDVVAFRQAGSQRLLVHRLVARAGDRYIFKGDNYTHRQQDGPLARESLLGIVAQVERKGHPVRLGLGAERGMIAFASRLGLLRPLVQAAAAVYRLVIKRS